MILASVQQQNDNETQCSLNIGAYCELDEFCFVPWNVVCVCLVNANWMNKRWECWRVKKRNI